MNSAVIVAIIVIAVCLLSYSMRKKRIMKQVKNNQKYKVPLSDDVQRIYYDNYEKQLKEQEEAEKTASDNAEAKPEESEAAKTKTKE